VKASRAPRYSRSILARLPPLGGGPRRIAEILLQPQAQAAIHVRFADIQPIDVGPHGSDEALVPVGDLPELGVRRRHRRSKMHRQRAPIGDRRDAISSRRSGFSPSIRRRPRSRTASSTMGRVRTSTAPGPAGTARCWSGRGNLRGALSLEQGPARGDAPHLRDTDCSIVASSSQTRLEMNGASYNRACFTNSNEGHSNPRWGNSVRRWFRHGTSPAAGGNR
jgi:hypothetical protein